MLIQPAVKILDQEITYTGSELRPHWTLEATGVYGSQLVAFMGPCKVPTSNLVDLEDQLNRDFIEAKSMLHIIAEFFGTTLEAGVLYQRLFMVWAERLLLERGVSSIRREGDDLFIENKKLSVSIATVSPVSVLIHWGINFDSAGAPVDAIGLKDLGWNREEVFSFAKDLFTQYSDELKEISHACVKVHPVIS